MNIFEKRALAYNAYRALRKLAAASDKEEITTSLNAAIGNGTSKPSKPAKAPAPKAPAMQMSKLVNMTPKRQKGYSGSFAKGKGTKRGKCC